ncbi:TPA: hypothetical protein I8438_005086 [Serratia marcescens]|uniref:hypothetical protein n=1 Tax=Serratia TaxID=613 RepID=UPI001364AE2B|nr:hypothetical protein [Serratia marcescens]EGT0505236.1 hypothetical protein [Serratia marcescens]HAT2213189.1 hypothetical protein [Serratia marcescens]HAT2224448.1 hypothetical protein [Serratia marcescens]HAT2276822.1 hypothetical protein [Serratia marcescens]HAT2335183.1 hypothetical protein [Serratia marcescens]
MMTIGAVLKRESANVGDGAGEKIRSGLDVTERKKRQKALFSELVGRAGFEPATN